MSSGVSLDTTSAGVFILTFQTVRNSFLLFISNPDHGNLLQKSERTNTTIYTFVYTAGSQERLPVFH